MKIYLLNGSPSPKGVKYIREGRCMQKTSSWSAVWPPISLAIIGALIGKNRDVRLIDCNVEPFNNKELLSDINEFNPNVLITSTGFPSIGEDMQIVADVKKMNPNIKTVGIGVYFTLLEEKSVDNYPQIDFACVGEPEFTVKELLDMLEAGKSDFSEVKGLIHRQGSKLVYNGPRDYIENLDVLPFPARGLLKNDKYTLPHNGHPFTLINFCRGCPYPCIFCIAPAYYGKKHRRHSIEYIIGEVKECIDKYNIKDFLFWGEAFTLDKKFCNTMCDRIMEEKLPIEWSTTTRADAIDEEMLTKMKKANCQLLGIGIESASQDILDRAKKQSRVEDVKKAVELCKKTGIRTMGHFIFGLPGETHQTAEATVRFVKELGLDYIQCYNAVPYPKTELWEYGKKHDLIKSSNWQDYDFGGNSIMATEALSPKDVDYYRVKTFKSFYLRLSFMLKQLLVIKPRQFLKPFEFFNWINMKR